MNARQFRITIKPLIFKIFPDLGLRAVLLKQSNKDWEQHLRVRFGPYLTLLKLKFLAERI